MNFADMSLNEKLELAEKQANDIRDHIFDYVERHSIDANVLLAALISLIGSGISANAGNDEELQDKMIASIARGLEINLAENGVREMDADMKKMFDN